MLSLYPRDETGGIVGMKRKLSLQGSITQANKRQVRAGIKTKTEDHPLAIIARQYGILQSIITHLRASDLLALALTSKALYKCIFSTSTSLENLLSRLQCSGQGIKIRNKRHKKSTFFYAYNCTEYVHCASDTIDRNIETKPCVKCKVATCNECRIHCVYQSIYEAPSGPDDDAELPNFSGFVLLQPLEQPVLSPHHLVSETSSNVPYWRDPSEHQGGPYHDQGYLDVPLETGASAPPECIENILDLDLGCHSLISMSGDSRYAAPSPVLLSMCQVTEARKVEICGSCAEPGTTHEPNTTGLNDTRPLPANIRSDKPHSELLKACHCTLRSRILDRWLCLRCYSAEESGIEERARDTNSGTNGICQCGERARHAMCLWCHGEIREDGEIL